MVLWCVAVVVAFALIAGCGPVGPYGVWTERPDTAMVDAGDAMDAQPVDMPEFDPLCRTQADCDRDGGYGGRCIYWNCAAPLGRCLRFEDGGARTAQPGGPCYHRDDEPNSQMCEKGYGCSTDGRCVSCGAD